jgi:hypothetical protein
MTNTKGAKCKIMNIMLLLAIAGVTVFVSMQAVNAQNNETETAKTKVDKLIQDTKRENATEESYRTELIDRIKNSTCTEDLQKLPELSKDDLPTKLGNASDIANKNESVILSFLNTTNLENYLKFCVREGKIK